MTMRRILTLINSGGIICSILLLITACKKKEGLEPVTDPVVVKFYPNSGNAGTLVNIEGAGFPADRSMISVLFGQQAAEVLSATPTRIVVRVPEGGAEASLSLVAGRHTIAVGAFTYQSLSIQDVSPRRAQIGAQIRLRGTGFTSVGTLPKVALNGVEAQVINASDTLLVVEVPVGSGLGAVKVTVDGSESLGPDFLYMDINRVKPVSGGAGTRVVIGGEGFLAEAAGNVVTFNGIRAAVLEASPDRLVVVAPADVDSGPVVVTVEGEPVVGPAFAVVPFPVITTVSPLSGPPGTEMTITGSQFSPEEGETHVYINHVEIPVLSVTEHEIRLAIPGGTGSGQVVVEVNDQATVGPVFRDQHLGVTGINPDNGMGGTEVVITGTGFDVNALSNRVYFNGLEAVVLEATPTTLKVRVPGSVTTGTVNVQVDGYQAASPTTFKRAGVQTLGKGQLDIAPDGGSIAVDRDGNVYVLEYTRHRIMKVSPEGDVSLLAGSSTGAEGMVDGTGADARFRFSRFAGLMLDEEQQLYVTDPGNRALRHITPAGVVTTVVDNFGGQPGKIARMTDGRMYVSNQLGSPMWLVSPADNIFQAFTGAQHAAWAANIRHAVDAANTFYTLTSFMAPGNYISRTRRTSTGWVPESFWVGAFFGQGYQDGVGNAALFNDIRALVSESAEQLLVLDANNYAIRRVHTPSATVSTMVRFAAGFEDGDFRTAKMSNAVWDLVLNADGDAIYILDCGNNAVRKVMLR